MVARRIASRLQFFGIQDAPRKRRPPSKEPGAWAGAKFCVHPNKVTQTVTQTKWDKGRTIIRYWQDQLEKSQYPTVCHKRLMQDRGFLVHLSMVYEFITPFLKGFHLTIDSWRPQRDKSGWKMPLQDWEEYLEVLQADTPAEEFTKWYDQQHGQAPQVVTAVPRFSQDVFALGELFSVTVPPEITLRSNEIYMVVYGFGDASGAGFGSSIVTETGTSVRVGTWSADESNESSNWRELTNVVEALEAEAQNQRLAQAETFFFTDNSVTESALYKGTSSSPKLFELVVRLKKLEANYSIKLRVSHVSGKRMIAQGTDGISRGVMNEGVLSGKSMLEYIQLHLGAIARFPPLLKWLHSALPGPAQLLSVDDWFQKGHDIQGWIHPAEHPFQLPVIKSGIYIWAPPPAAASIAVNELRKARHKRQESVHVFVSPRLMTPYWRKSLEKASDLLFELPAGCVAWPRNMYEPLLIGVCFPYLSFNPWTLAGTPGLFNASRYLRRVFSKPEVDGRYILRKLLRRFSILGTLPELLVREVLYPDPLSRPGVPC